jgi:hypothetical protein
MLRRIGLVCAIPVVLVIAVPGSASAGTTIGANFPAPAGACGTNQTVLQTGSPGSQYAAQSDGVITSWTFQAGALAPSTLKLKVGRSAGGADFQIIGESPEKHPGPNTSSTYTDVHIPVGAGDILGYWADGPTSYCGRSGSGYLFRFRSGDQLPGTTETYGSELSGFQIDFSARLEPDADHDTFGDETQDLCPTNASTQGPCPMSATGQRAAALKKCKKKAKKKDWTKKRLQKCKKKARLLPV